MRSTSMSKRARGGICGRFTFLVEECARGLGEGAARGGGPSVLLRRVVCACCAAAFLKAEPSRERPNLAASGLIKPRAAQSSRERPKLAASGLS